jgi:hypothetical protein
MLNSVKNNNATAPIQKQAVQNSTKSGSDFQSALNKQFFTADGSFILDKNIQVIKPKEERPVTTQEVQNELGVSKTEAEKILNEFKLSVPIDYSPKESDVSIKDLVDGSRSLKETIEDSETNQLLSFIISSVDAAVTSKSSTGFKQVKPDFTNMSPNEFNELYKSGHFAELPPIVLPSGLDLTKDTKSQMDASLDTKVNYVELVQKQIEFEKSVGNNTDYLMKQLNLMKNFNA